MNDGVAIDINKQQSRFAVFLRGITISKNEFVVNLFLMKKSFS